MDINNAFRQLLRSQSELTEKLEDLLVSIKNSQELAEEALEKVKSLKK